MLTCLSRDLPRHRFALIPSSAPIQDNESKFEVYSLVRQTACKQLLTLDS